MIPPPPAQSPPGRDPRRDGAADRAAPSPARTRPRPSQAGRTNTGLTRHEAARSAGQHALLAATSWRAGPDPTWFGSLVQERCPAPGLPHRSKGTCLFLTQADAVGGEEADPACWARTEPVRGGSSLLPAPLPEDQGSSSPWQSPQGLSPSQPRETRLVGEAAGKSHGQLQGDGSCQPSTPATTASRQQVPAAAQRLPPAQRPPPPAMTIVTCAGDGDVAAGILRGTLATGTACFSPARFQLLAGFVRTGPSCARAEHNG